MAVKFLQEGTAHAASDDELIGHFEHSQDQLNLVSHLRTSKYHKHWFFWRIQKSSQKLQFFLKQEPSGSDSMLHSNHTGVGPMCTAECIINIDIS